TASATGASWPATRWPTGSQSTARRSSRSRALPAPRIATAAEALVERVVVDGPALAGEGVDELHRLGLLVGRDARSAVLDDVVLGGGGTVLQRHDRLHVLAPAFVGHADDRCLFHGRVAGEAALDLGRVDVLGGRLHDAGLGPDEADRAVGLTPAEVVGVVPLAGLALGVDVGSSVVAVHDDRAPRHDLADFAGRDLVAGGVDDPDLRHR